MNAVSEQPAIQSATSQTEAKNASPRFVLLGGVLSTALVLSWLLLIHNRFFTPYEGWFSYYGLLMKNGAMPYRDFYFFTQPFHLLISRILVEFGDKLIYFRYYGLVERTVLTAALYFLLSRSFSAAASFCGTLASSFFLLAYGTDSLYSYLYTCLLFFVVALVCLRLAWRNPRRRSLWMLFCGMSAALAFFTKQSNGLLAAAALVLAMLAASGAVRQFLRDLVPYLTGFSLASLPFLAWLTWNGLWKVYLDEVFRGAAASKGGPILLVGFLTRQLHVLPLLLFAAIAVAGEIFAAKKQLTLLAAHTRAAAIRETTVMAIVAAAIAWVMISVHRVGSVPLFLLRCSSSVVVEAMLYALIPVTLMVALRLVTEKDRRWICGQEMTVALLIAAFFWTWSCGMSWAVQEQSVIPGMSLLFAFIYDRVQFRQRAVMSGLVVAVTIGIVCLSVWQKWSCAFDWEGWRQGISSGQVHSHAEQLSEYSMDPDEAAMYDAIFADLATNTRPGDKVLTFPSLPLFNIVSGRPQPTFAPVHTLDVCPDYVSRSDALTVARLRPRMIVNLKMSDVVWNEHDKGLRGGSKSGEHEFQEAIDKLTASSDYRLIRTVTTPFYHMSLRVWARD